MQSAFIQAMTLAMFIVICVLSDQYYVKIEHRIDGTWKTIPSVNTIQRCAFACDKHIITCHAFSWDRSQDTPCQLLLTLDKTLLKITPDSLMNYYLPTIWNDTKKILYFSHVKDIIGAKEICSSLGGSLPGYPKTKEERQRLLAFGRFFIDIEPVGTEYANSDGIIVDPNAQWCPSTNKSAAHQCSLLSGCGILGLKCNVNRANDEYMHTLCFK